MSSRSKKNVKTTTTIVETSGSKGGRNTSRSTTVASGGGSSEGSSGGRGRSSSKHTSYSMSMSSSGRSPSPTVIGRLEEKDQLAGLNDRLAQYIDRVRFLETENAKLSKQIYSQESYSSKEATNIKVLYDQELADARKLLDETAKEKARLQIEVGRFSAQVEEWKDKFYRADGDHKRCEKKLLSAEAMVNDLQARVSDAVNQRKYFENEYNKLLDQVAKLEKQLNSCKKQLEDETIKRVDLENRYQSATEELAFNNTVHEQEMNETRTRSEVTIEEVDGRLQEEYESKLAEALRAMREENDFRIRIAREETENKLQEKFARLNATSKRDDSAVQYAREEMLTLRKRYEDLQGELTKCQGNCALYEKRVQDLEDQLSRLRDVHSNDLRDRDSEIMRLRESLEEQVQEYRDLLDVKIALDVEIAAYRNLLDAEEVRLTKSPLSITSSGRKRKRIVEESITSSKLMSSPMSYNAGGEYSSSGSSFAASSTAKGLIEINDTDPEGKYIQIRNTSASKEQSLGGWQLRHIVGDDETTYKFHRSVIIKPEAEITVYSSNAEETHDPPSTLLMKGQAWYSGNNMRSILLNSKGEEMATREMKKNMGKSTFKRFRNVDGVDGYEGDPRQVDEKCAIM